MTSDVDLIMLILMGVAIVMLVVWALLGPRRRTDESGHHVDLAESTRQREVERERRDGRADHDR